MHFIPLRDSMVVLALASLTFACGRQESASSLETAPHFDDSLLPADLASRAQKITVLAEHPHDAASFTEGLFFKDGVLYEGTGREGSTNLRKVDPATGKVLKTVVQNQQLFGEGITVWNGLIYQLTYKNHVGYVYQETATGFKRKKSFSVATEGWGLTNDDQYLIRSDGTEHLYFVDPKTFKTVRTITVRDGNKLQTNINEMEYVGGAILANIFPSPYIARIDPATGNITNWYDASELAAKNPSADINDVLNGIAYDAATARFFMTGKHFKSLYEVSLPGYEKAQ